MFLSHPTALPSAIIVIAKYTNHYWLLTLLYKTTAEKSILRLNRYQVQRDVFIQTVQLPQTVIADQFLELSRIINGCVPPFYFWDTVQCRVVCGCSDSSCCCHCHYCCQCYCELSYDLLVCFFILITPFCFQFLFGTFPFSLISVYYTDVDNNRTKSRWL